MMFWAGFDSNNKFFDPSRLETESQSWVYIHVMGLFLSLIGERGYFFFLNLKLPFGTLRSW